ncbi:MAG: hypothetical protein M5U09_20060 [Gammaproteobacteria bacterium]|nr:hypothetical protein [Gammaproteobacteria bacterium]
MSESRCAVNETNSLYDEDVKSTYRQELSRFEESHLADVARSEPWSIVYDEERTRSPVTFSRRRDVAYLRESCGVYERFAVKLNDDPAWFDCLTFQYDHRRGNITAEEISRLQVYLPHIAQSVALSRWFRILRARFDAVLGALDRLRVGVFLVTPRMQIVVANKTGPEIVDRRECLSIRDRGQLKLRSAAQQARLAEAVKKRVRLPSPKAITNRRSLTSLAPRERMPFVSRYHRFGTPTPRSEDFAARYSTLSIHVPSIGPRCSA